MGIFRFFRRRKALMPDRVAFSSEMVTHIRPDGTEESIRWDDLHEVGILTTDDGPFAEDMFFLLLGADGESGCAIPQSSEGSQRLLQRLQQLPDFNSNAVIEAMGSTSNAKFACWKRPAA